MKVFAIITAGLMAAGAGAYYLHSGSHCPLNESCPVAMSGGCCLGEEDKSSCCTNPCPACANDCLSCCDVCEVCCTTGVQTSVAKADCCATGADCCISECCFGAAKAIANPVGTSPAVIATSAVLAGVGAK